MQDAAANEQLIEKYAKTTEIQLVESTPMQMERTAMGRFSRNGYPYQMRERTLLTIQPLVESSLGGKEPWR